MTPDGARLMGLALEDHIKTIISKAIHAASHRSIQFKETEHIEKLNDVKSRLKYISGRCSFCDVFLRGIQI